MSPSMTAVYRNDPVSIVRHTTPDQWNEGGTPSIEAVMGMVVYKSKLVRNAQGEEALSTIQVLLAFDSTLTHEDKVRIGAVDYSILSIDLVRDFSVSDMWVNLT